MIPNPVHGASSRTRSNEPGNNCEYFLPSLHVTAVLVIPKRDRLYYKAFNRYFLKSLANMHPVFFINWAM